eukprot:scaffold31922_cov76-Amphora_coffeaeformis.AAC.1
MAKIIANEMMTATKNPVDAVSSSITDVHCNTIPANKVGRQLMKPQNTSVNLLGGVCFRGPVTS